MTGETLFLAHRVPYPPDRGDKIRAWHLLRHLSARGRVHLAGFADDPRDLNHDTVLAEVCASHTVLWRGKAKGRAAIEGLATGRPVSLAAFHDRAMRGHVRRLLAERPIDTIFVFSGQMAQYVPADWQGRFFMDFCDVDSAKFAAFAERGPMTWRWLMRREARLLQAFEAATAARADASLFVSEAEAALFRKATSAADVHAVENGIDCDRFDPATPPVEAARPLIVFTGQMDYAPNIEAVCWFAHEVLPAIQGHFAIVGRAPAAEVRALANQRVTVTGEVDDVRGWLAAADLVVAPLKLARGVQNKVLEAMAMARPVLATPAAAEGIDHAGTLAVADSAGAFADTARAMLADRARSEALGRAARARVEARYGWDARLATLDALLDAVAA
ncbi:TIGR03087 family PEP-CTERM/XrtA system glycosyltransferase [Sphingomonas sp.]